MENNRFYDFLERVKYAPITPMQALELFHRLFEYMEAVKHYNEADTNELVTLAIKELDESRDRYESFRAKLNCGIPPLLYIRHSIY